MDCDRRMENCCGLFQATKLTAACRADTVGIQTAQLDKIISHKSVTFYCVVTVTQKTVDVLSCLTGIMQNNWNE
jgi:beta-xylosidase